MPEREYILFCDESDAVGDYFSNFYGGVLVGGSKVVEVTARINAVKAAHHLHGEIKWQKVTTNYLEKYKAVMDALFAELKAGSVKLRIMFTQNAHEPTELSDEQRRLSYWLLYYQFVKHAFGFVAMPRGDVSTHLRVYFDQFPRTGEDAAKFKGFIEASKNPSNSKRPEFAFADKTLPRSTHTIMRCCNALTWC